MSELKAIPTKYKGYTFRSRLEVRWAGFFDLMGVNWEYEPEGFVLPSGAQYLPDFRLTFERIDSPPAVLWCEVKPSGVTADRKFDEFAEAIKKVWVTNGSYQGTRLLAGDPYGYYTGKNITFHKSWMIEHGQGIVCLACLAAIAPNRIITGCCDPYYHCDFCDFTTDSFETMAGLAPYNPKYSVLKGRRVRARSFALTSNKGAMEPDAKWYISAFRNLTLQHALTVRKARFCR